MQPSQTFLTVVVAGVILVPFCAAQSPQEPEQPGRAQQPAAVSFPYVAETTGNDVYVRSGPGSNYYRCGKLDAGARVVVVAHEHSWSKIKPLADSFSWISSRYIKIEPENASIGIVTGDNVRVWAGSPYYEPIHSTSLQTHLSEGDTVRLLGEEKADYYKIEPPEGAYFYVSSQYTKYLAAGEQVRPEVGPVPEEPAEVEPEEPAEVEPEEPAIERSKPDADSYEKQKLQEYYDLTAKLEAEMEKPLAEQDYGELAGEFKTLSEDARAGKAARYAEYQLGVIDRIRLARRSRETLSEQEQELAEKLRQIQARRRRELQSITDLGRYAAIGYLRPSQIYTGRAGKQRYILADAGGKIICYAEPVIGAGNLGEMLNKKVGLIGTIEPDPETSSAVVEFTEVVRLD